MEAVIVAGEVLLSVSQCRCFYRERSGLVKGPSPVSLLVETGWLVWFLGGAISSEGVDKVAA